MANNNPYLTITLTGRPPVKIKKDDWPVVASASENDRHGAQIGNEPNREDDWDLKVREHEDGRRIVYGIYDHSTAWQNESGLNIRGGELIDKDADVVEAIQRVAANMAERVNAESFPGDVFLRLGHECTADLPAVEI
jgi:hypothetical protein